MYVINVGNNCMSMLLYKSLYFNESAISLQCTKYAYLKVKVQIFLKCIVSNIYSLFLTKAYV